MKTNLPFASPSLAPAPSGRFTSSAFSRSYARSCTRSSIPLPRRRSRRPRSACPCFPDIELALQSTKPEGVIIATPNHLHVPNGLAAVKAGVPMLGEKPLSTDVEARRAFGLQQLDRLA